MTSQITISVRATASKIVIQAQLARNPHVAQASPSPSQHFLQHLWKIALKTKSAMFRIPATIKKNGILGSILHVSEETFESLMLAETSISPKSTFRHPMTIIAIDSAMTINDPQEIPAHFF